MLRSMGLQRVRHDRATELTELNPWNSPVKQILPLILFSSGEHGGTEAYSNSPCT